MTEREASIRSTVHAATDANLPAARELVDNCALPRVTDSRRLLAVQGVLGDIADGMARGHTDLSESWLMLLGIAQDALEETLEQQARRADRSAPEDFLP